jgi:hypothetical protein
MRCIDYANIESKSVKMEMSKKLNNFNQFIVKVIINITKMNIK